MVCCPRCCARREAPLGEEPTDDVHVPFAAAQCMAELPVKPRLVPLPHAWSVEGLAVHGAEGRQIARARGVEPTTDVGLVGWRSRRASPRPPRGSSVLLERRARGGTRSPRRLPRTRRGSPGGGGRRRRDPSARVWDPGVFVGGSTSNDSGSGPGGGFAPHLLVPSLGLADRRLCRRQSLAKRLALRLHRQPRQVRLHRLAALSQPRQRRALSPVPPSPTSAPASRTAPRPPVPPRTSPARTAPPTGSENSTWFFLSMRIAIVNCFAALA